MKREDFLAWDIDSIIIDHFDRVYGLENLFIWNRVGLVNQLRIAHRSGKFLPVWQTEEHGIIFSYKNKRYSYQEFISMLKMINFL